MIITLCVCYIPTCYADSNRQIQLCSIDAHDSFVAKTYNMRSQSSVRPIYHFITCSASENIEQIKHFTCIPYLGIFDFHRRISGRLSETLPNGSDRATCQPMCRAALTDFLNIFFLSSTLEVIISRTTNTY